MVEEKRALMSEKNQTRPSLEVPGRSSGRVSPPGAAYNEVYGQDPRTSSMQSLVPSLPEYEEVQRRKLLIIYIHGFMGNDTSFQSFPAHVHKYLKLALAETHVIHSKIYPKYKTYKAIEVARDNLSKWLEPHEGLLTDVILVGHSMGGLLAADLVLMPTTDRRNPRFFQHRILGTVNLDAPLLGLHPGIIVSGISSLFRSKPESPKPYGDSTQQGSSSQVTSGISSPDPTNQSQWSTPSVTPMPDLSQTLTYDPNFNPNFPNDVRLQDRGWWKNVVHFVKKHNSEGLVDAATHHIMSHMEFGSCLMDLKCLKLRYENLRKLEDVDDIKHNGMPHVPPRVRFIQYYTVCHGLPKKPKDPKSEQRSERSVTAENLATIDDTLAAPSTPRIEIEDAEAQRRQSLRDIIKEQDTALGVSDISEDERASLEILDPEPISDEYHTPDEGSPLFENPNHTLPGTTMISTSNIKENGSNEHCQKGGVSDVHGASSSEPTDAMKKTTESDPDAPSAADVTEELSSLTLDLTPVPDLPEKPETPHLDKYTDKDARKQAEKEAKRVQKAYDQAVKNRDKAIKERQKIIEKRRKKRASEVEKRQKETEKREKESQKQRKKEEVAAVAAVASSLEEQKSLAQAAAAAAIPSPTETTRASTTSPGQPASLSRATSMLTQETSLTSVDSSRMSPFEEVRGTKDKKPENTPKPKKDRKFCMTPSKVNGQLDPKWVRIFMKDVDEVGAHTGLFFPGPHYEKLVGDVGDMIIGWVQEDATKRAILEIP